MHLVRSARGFSMMELVVGLAVISILASLSAVALSKLKTRGNFSSATGDFISTLRTARAEAFARSNPTVVIVDPANARWWAIEDVLGNFSLATFDPANPAPANPDGGVGDRLIYSGSLPAGISFGPSGGWGTALPPPFSGIPTGYVNIVLADGGSGGTADISTDGGSAAPNYKWCSFCDPSSQLGAITFLPAGGAAFSGGPFTIGQQIAIQDVAVADAGVTATGIIDFAILAATGNAEAVTVR